MSVEELETFGDAFRDDRDERLGPVADATLSVMLADADPLARRMVCAALQDEPDLAVVAEASDSCEALELARRLHPAVAVVEATLPDATGGELVRRLTAAVPVTKIAVLSVDADEDIALAALRAGAIAYLTKDIQPGALPQLVRTVARGEPVIPPPLLPLLLKLIRQMPDAGWRPVRSRLTTREWEIVELLEKGASTEDIAACLVVSISTVYSHVKSLMRKLGVHSRSEVVAVARSLRREEIAVPQPARPAQPLVDPMTT
jgi:DNA-binding NarL/FixJ family response regulator